MSKVNSCKSVEIKIVLEDIVTPKACSVIIAEIIKYIVYSKQQIPYPYERLKYYIKKRKDLQKPKNVSDSDNSQSNIQRKILAVDKHFKKIEEAFEILENTFQNIEVELINAGNNAIHEIAILFGPTIMSPKDIYRIKIPVLSLGHCENRHGIQKQKHNLFRDILVSDQLQTSLGKHLGLTNMFVLLKFRNGITSKSGWFFPKDNYKISPRFSNVNLSFETNKLASCTCFTPILNSNITPYSDSDCSGNDSSTSFGAPLSNPKRNCVEVSSETSLDIECEIIQCCCSGDYVRTNPVFSDSENWFQTKQSLKGFRDFKIDGKPIVDIWHRP
uniref:MAD2L1-binding protein n=1 Tax=Clastoptera arizonana TaxID=38151 RepID=A0A1B6DUJ5_9HEMI